MKDIFETTLGKMFSEQLSPEVVMSIEDTGWSESLSKLIDESGFSLALTPEKNGGAGASWADLCGVIQLCGRYTLPLPLPEAIFANWLLGVCDLDGLSGSLSIAASNDLEWSGDTLTGQVQQVPWGRHVDAIVTVIKSDKPRVVVLPVSRASSQHLATNTANEPRDDIAFSACKPIAEAPLPDDINVDIVQLGGAMIRSAQISGALEELISLAVDYVNEREQFGKPIGRFQAIQHQLAVLAEHVGAARIAAQAAFEESGDSLASLQIMAAKTCNSEAAGVGASVGHAVHGAIGFTYEYRLHLLTRRLWSWRSEYGSSTYWATALGESVCRGGVDNVWPMVISGYLPTAN